MTHYSKDEWIDYVSDQIPEKQRKQYEDHLYSCDDCLSIYMKVIEEMSDELPVFKDNNDFFMNNIITEIFNEKQITPKKKHNRVFQSVFFNYGVAAAITLILLTSGMFQNMMTFVEGFEQSRLSVEKKASLTNSLMEKFTTVLDSIELNQKEGHKR